MAARTRDKRTIMQVIDDLTGLWERRIREAFFTAISDITDNVLLNRVVDAIEAGDVERVFRMIGFNERSIAPIVAAIEGAYSAGVMGVTATFPVRVQNEIVRGVFRMDDRNIAAENWLLNHSSKLIVDITEEARQTTRQALAAGMERGDNPRKVALDIVGRRAPGSTERQGGVIGLAPNQQTWVETTRSQLQLLDRSYFTKELRDKRFDGIVEKAIRLGQPLTVVQVEQITSAYASRALKYRGEMIGRTEALHSLNQSAYRAIHNAIDADQLPSEAVKRTWDSAGDNRVRHSHRLMDGQERGLDEPFTTPPRLLAPGGYKLMYPLDGSLGAPASEIVACRCRVQIEIDWGFELDREEF